MPSEGSTELVLEDGTASGGSVHITVGSSGDQSSSQPTQDKQWTEWTDVYRPIAKQIAYCAFQVVQFLPHRAYLDGEPGKDWLYLLVFCSVLVAAVVFFLAIVALVFPTKITAEWRCRPIARRIVCCAVHFLPCMFQLLDFGGIRGADWLDLPMFGVVVVEAFALLLGTVAFHLPDVPSHSPHITEEGRCRLVKLSLVGVMIGIALALISFICRAATNGQPS